MWQTSAPFGYRLVDGEYTVVPEEAEVVRKIFALYLQGYGVNVIAKTIRDTDGDKRVWNRQGIKYILTNEKYIGDTMWQKSFTPAVLSATESSEPWGIAEVLLRGNAGSNRFERRFYSGKKFNARA